MTKSEELVSRARLEITEIGVDEIGTMAADPGVALLDVRDSKELESGMVPGAIHAPRGMLEFYLDRESEFFLPALKGKQTVVMICGSGGRAALATKLAQDLGWSAYSLAGGMKAWRAAQDLAGQPL